MAGQRKEPSAMHRELLTQRAFPCGSGETMRFFSMVRCLPPVWLELPSHLGVSLPCQGVPLHVLVKVASWSSVRAR